MRHDYRPRYNFFSHIRSGQLSFVIDYFIQIIEPNIFETKMVTKYSSILQSTALDDLDIIRKTPVELLE
jgi:hypothetical protein